MGTVRAGGGFGTVGPKKTPAMGPAQAKRAPSGGAVVGGGGGITGSITRAPQKPPQRTPAPKRVPGGGGVVTRRTF